MPQLDPNHRRYLNTIRQVAQYKSSSAIVTLWSLGLAAISTYMHRPKILASVAIVVSMLSACNWTPEKYDHYLSERVSRVAKFMRISLILSIAADWTISLVLIWMLA